MKDLYPYFSKVKGENQPIELDFHNSVHQELFFNIYGGKEHLKNKFIEKYESFKKTQSHQQTKKVGEPDAFQDGVDIVYGFYDDIKKQLYCRAMTSIERNAKYICELIQVYDNNNQLVGGIGMCTANTHHTILNYAKNIDLSSNDIKSLKFIYYSDWEDQSTGQIRAMLYKTEDEVIWQNQENVKSITVLDPIHKQTSSDEAIIICYDRQSQSGEVVDYDYSSAFDEKTHRQLLYLDLGADIELDDAALPFNYINLSQLFIKLDCQSGFAYYSKQGREQEIMNSFVKTDKGFVFHLDKDWKGTVPSARLPIKEPIDIYIRGEFICNQNKQKGTFIIGSNLDPAVVSPHIKQISQLQLLWGCLAGDSQIKMANGCLVQAKDIKMGDCVCLSNGTGLIRNVYKGREERLLQITTKQHHILKVSQYHPILTNRGFVFADDIRGDDKIMNEYGEYEEILFVYEVNGEEVYNFDVDSCESAKLICNHLIVGDNRMQNEYMRKQNNDSQLVDQYVLKLKEWMVLYES